MDLPKHNGDASTGGAAAAHAPLSLPTIRTILAGILLAMFLSALEQTIVAPALATIGTSLNEVENLSWVVTAYLLTTTVATPLFGKLSDIHGRRAMMLISIGIFIIGSVACALAPTMTVLILARALQGLGGGGLLPLAQTVIADLLSPRERPVVQGYVSVMFTAACVLGPVLGGVLSDYAHWSLIFWIMLPLGLISLVMTDRALRKLPRHDRPHRLDLPGAALMVAAALALLLALSLGGVRYPWISSQVLGLVGLSALLWIGFALRLLRAPEPFIPLAMLRDPVVAIVILAGFCGVGTTIGLSIFVPLYLELVLGHSAVGAGVALIAFMTGATIWSMYAGRLLARLTRYRIVPVTGLAVAIATLVVLALWPAGHSLLTISALLALGVGGLGVLWPSTTVIIQNVVPLHQTGTATGTLNFFRQLGGSLIVAVFGAIVLGGLDTHGQGAMTVERLTRGAAGAADFVGPFRLVFLAAAGFLAVALLAMLVIEERPMRGPSAQDALPSKTPPRQP
jgi:EmrB/QacA subfamily drug resistance transporter